MAANWEEGARASFTQTAPLATMSALVRAQLQRCWVRRTSNYYKLHPEARPVIQRLSGGLVMDGLGSESVFLRLVEDVNSAVTLTKAAVMHLLRSSLVLEEEVWGYRLELPHPALELVLLYASRERGLERLGHCCLEVGDRVTEMFYLRWTCRRVVNILKVFKCLMHGFRYRPIFEFITNS